MEQRCRVEIEQLHHFFADWFNGQLDDDDASFDRLPDALAPAFEIISPGGRRTGRSDLLTSLRSAHAMHRADRIEIRIASVRARALTDDVWLATYEEWQRHGGAAADRGRLSTVVLRRREAGPNGLSWLHVHEVWLPAS